MSIRRTMVFTIQRLRHGACHGLIQGRCCVAFFRKNHHSKFRKSLIYHYVNTAAKVEIYFRSRKSFYRKLCDKTVARNRRSRHLNNLLYPCEVKTRQCESA